MILAHLTKANGIRKEQSLKEHCINTARYASESLRLPGFYHTAYLAGLLHDMGKATEKFHVYLEKAYRGEEVLRGSVNHTFAGVVYLLENYHMDIKEKYDCLASEVIAFAIGGHHGLFDCADLEGKNGFLHRLQKDKKELAYEEAVENYFENVISEEEAEKQFHLASQEVQQFFQKAKALFSSQEEVGFQVGLLSRLVLSAVIYGDRRDTAEFMDQVQVCKPVFNWRVQRDFLEGKIACFDSATKINQIRKEISQQCLESAGLPAGIYRLNVPTGAGKTLCTLRYALAHAEKFQKKRIIFIIPLLSVLDQNAKVIREYIKDSSCVLEHHSNVLHEKQQQEILDEYELLAEQWDAPVIISTLVQLLNILFMHQTSAAGRMQALCDSVIIIDEIQSLPKKTVLLFNMAINFLSQFCNATIVLSSATQPCFETVQWPVKYADRAELVQLSQKQKNVFKRSEIVDKISDSGMDLQEFSDFCISLMEIHNALLVICNTKREARELFAETEEIAKAKGWKIYHLSTSMCKKHRMDVLRDLQEELLLVQSQENGGSQKLICVATQLVEAGVDFSFDGVVRVIAGIDNLVQAAGRCNRSNEYKNWGRVYLVNLKNENLGMLKEIKAAQNSTLQTLSYWKKLEGSGLFDDEMINRFYQYLFRSSEIKKEMRYPKNNGHDIVYLTDLLANKNKYVDIKKEKPPFIMHQPFKTVGKMFQVFEQDTIDILVPYEEGSEVIEKIRGMKGSEYCYYLLQELKDKLKQYSVSIYQKQMEALYGEGLLESCLDGRLYILNSKAYHEKYGVDDKVKQAVEDFIL
ncbi:MAG: CRISPR-associated helicase Cas3' [Lachnospiraceae bacterium]|nr:CRISPR-associated helicase Cas3' [Lachnospiraceae bacterium]